MRKNINLLKNNTKYIEIQYIVLIIALTQVLIKFLKLNAKIDSECATSRLIIITIRNIVLKRKQIRKDHIHWKKK